ncbi:MAG: nuclear transport factor 2 family protein [Acidobacteria bacterium]|nr:MAG: nuclear transport factor 2 family protein [Acidobacteriota bacterium]
MIKQSQFKSAEQAMRQINRAWLDGKVEDLAPRLHSDIVMVLRGWTGRVRGKQGFLAGFREFLQSSRIHEFNEQDIQVDVAGNAAVVTFRYEMVYERSNARFRSTGRDLWVLQHQGNSWIAVWRTMLEVEENPA